MISTRREKRAASAVFFLLNITLKCRKVHPLVADGNCGRMKAVKLHISRSGLYKQMYMCVFTFQLQCCQVERQRDIHSESGQKREADRTEQEARPNMGTGDAQRIPSFHSNRQVQDTGS